MYCSVFIIEWVYEAYFSDSDQQVLKSKHSAGAWKMFNVFAISKGLQKQTSHTFVNLSFESRYAVFVLFFLCGKPLYEWSVRIFFFLGKTNQSINLYEQNLMYYMIFSRKCTEFPHSKFKCVSFFQQSQYHTFCCCWKSIHKKHTNFKNSNENKEITTIVWWSFI